MAARRKTWSLVRLVIYLAVIVVLFLTRAGGDWKRIWRTIKGDAPAPSTLAIAGHALAPSLVDRLVAGYRHDDPDLTVTVLDDGTNRSLEDLMNGLVGAAFLDRAPTAAEQAACVEATGDSVNAQPVAIGAIIVLAAQDDTTALTPPYLAGVLAGKARGPDRVFMPDPDAGLWDAVGQALGLTGPPLPDSPVVFVADPAAVVGAVTAAVVAGESAWGLVSALNAPVDPDGMPPAGLRFLPARSAPDSAAVGPAYGNVARGRYPLHHELLIACRSGDRGEGGKFLTHLTSARGLRQVERAGVVPARLVLREIRLSREPLGK